ncbi:hypothetical protein BDB00DRAFT_839457, partial [Zychaea mexicana]|uniref:uncharacterized protein n=1 Tax=Zychaea mexicana TaxID=64656 RepID=UPI0022FDDFD2
MAINWLLCSCQRVFSESSCRQMACLTTAQQAKVPPSQVPPKKKLSFFCSRKKWKTSTKETKGKYSNTIPHWFKNKLTGCPMRLLPL